MMASRFLGERWTNCFDRHNFLLSSYHKTDMDIIHKIRSLTWRPWLERNFSPCMISLFKDGIRKEFFEKIGVKGVSCRAILFQNGVWYESDDVWAEMKKDLEKNYLKKHSVFDLTKSLKRFYGEKKKRLQMLAKTRGNPIQQLAEAYEILTTLTTFIWATHGLEEVYKERLKREVPKYVKTNVDEFINSASFPSKKTARAQMEDMMRKGELSLIIAKKFGWLRARDLGLAPFNEEDIAQMRKELKPATKHKKVKIPPQLAELFSEMRELVYFRTLRTDAWYEGAFLARPLFQHVAEFYKIPFSELGHYPVYSLLKGKPEKYSTHFTFACYEDECVFSEEPIVKETTAEKSEQVQGMIAYRGIVRGTVKIVRRVTELDKVKEGDILVTQMTFPAFLPAMNRAAAFVTDEGGVTCHAAIVAREMKKPCVIGTKNATKVFKDGDRVEVDADKGIVRKIS